MNGLNKYDNLMQNVGKLLISYVFPVEMNRIGHISPTPELMGSLLMSKLSFKDSFLESHVFNMMMYKYFVSLNHPWNFWDHAELKEKTALYDNKFQKYISDEDNKDGCENAFNLLSSWFEDVRDKFNQNWDSCTICHGVGRHCTQFDAERILKNR